MAKNNAPLMYASFGKPDFSKIKLDSGDFQTRFHSAMIYLHAEISYADLKKEVIKYLKSVDTKHPLLSSISGVDEKRIAVFGKYMYIINHKGEIPQEIMEVLIPKLEDTVRQELEKNASKEQPKEVTDPVTPISIQDRLMDRARQVASEIEGWIDEFSANKTVVKTTTDFDTLFKTSELKAPHMRFMKSIFENRAQEIGLAAEGKDRDLVEAYANFTKKELKLFDQFFKNMFSACDMLNESAKANRVPRKKKAISQEKVVSKLRYKKEEPSLGLASLNPVQIIGSREVWLYNVKTRKLAQYKAMDERGLLIKGTSILNYGSDSKEKILRKPSETLAEFKKASKVKLRTFLKDLTTVDTDVNGKVNENHVILRIDK